MLEALADLGRTRNILPTPEEEAATLPDIRMHLKALIARKLWDSNEYFRITNSADDREFAKAVEILQHPAEYDRLLGNADQEMTPYPHGTHQSVERESGALLRNRSRTRREQPPLSFRPIYSAYPFSGTATLSLPLVNIRKLRPPYKMPEHPVRTETISPSAVRTP